MFAYFTEKGLAVVSYVTHDNEDWHQEANGTAIIQKTVSLLKIL